MQAKTFTSTFIQILGKIRILQTGQKIVDYSFTALWTLINMVVPVLVIVMSKDSIVNNLNTSSLTRLVPNFHKSILRLVVLSLQVPIISSIGILNPDLVENPCLQLPARPLMWIICLVEIGFAFVQYAIRIINSMVMTCDTDGHVCSLNVVTFLTILQFVIQRFATITIVGISSKQMITALETQIVNLESVSKQIRLFRKIKNSLSALLFVSLSYEILDCIVNSFNLMYGKTDKMEGLIQTLFSFSIVFYYCLTLDDCFVAFKNHIAVVR